MKCCVPNCPNTYEKSVKLQGLTFHNLPKDPDQGAAWIRALASAGCRISQRLAVCCEHFLPDDFDDSRPNQRRLQPGVVPTLLPQYVSRKKYSNNPADPDEDGGRNLTPPNRTGLHLPKTGRNGKKKDRALPCSEIIQAEQNNKLIQSAPLPPEELKMAPLPPDELKVCIVCLAVDIKSYDMKDFKLSENFKNITGISACDEKEGALLRICWECAARLTAAAAFRHKALFSHSLLKDLVLINRNHLAVLKRLYHSSLKSPLTIQTVFTSSDIDCGDAVSETKEVELFSDDSDNSEVNTELKLNLEENDFDEKDDVQETETDFEEDDIVEEKETDFERADIVEEKDTDLEDEEPLIEIPMATDMGFDPIAENNFNIQTQIVKNEAFLELAHFDDDLTFSIEDNEDEVKNTEVQISNNDEIISEDTPMTINDGDIVLLEDNAGEKTKVVVIGNILNDSAREGDILRLPEPVAVNKAKKKKICPNRLNDREKQKIIALKANGLSDSEIAKETGKSVACVTAWWHRYSQEDSEITEECIPGTIEEPDPDNPVEAGKDIVACSPTVRRRLYQAGLEHILMKKPGTVNTGQRVSKFKAKYDNLKQRIIALKQEGLSNGRIAFLLETSRNMVLRWWKRWCNEGHLNTRKSSGRRKMTTAQEDQLLIDRVLREQTIHTPSLARQFGISPRTCTRRLADAGFKRSIRERYVPLKAGRTKNVDEHLKQRIITMKQNGASVTEMANEFRVPRTTIYQWWRRWCNENRIKPTIENNTSATEHGPSSADDINTDKIGEIPTLLPVKDKKSVWVKLPDAES